MKKMKMPQVFGVLAILGYVLRRLVYAGTVDEKNLIMTGHPLVVLLWILTAAVLALAVWAGGKELQPERTYRTASSAFMAHGLLGVGMVGSVWLCPVALTGVPGLLWKVLSVAGAVCLMYAGFEQLRGKKPYFVLYAAACLFFAVHVIANYQIWCSNPQFTDYAFGLLGSVCLGLHCYQLCALPVGMGNRKLLTVTALAGAYLCAAEIPRSPYPMLYFTAALFCLSNLEWER